MYICIYIYICNYIYIYKRNTYIYMYVYIWTKSHRFKILSQCINRNCHDFKIYVLKDKNVKAPSFQTSTLQKYISDRSIYNETNYPRVEPLSFQMSKSIFSVFNNSKQNNIKRHFRFICFVIVCTLLFVFIYMYIYIYIYTKYIAKVNL